LQALLDDSDQLISSGHHGDLPRWQRALSEFPSAEPFFNGALPAPVLGLPTDYPEKIRSLLQEFHPWRKGPLEIAGIPIDTEWHSDWKWDRISPAINLEGHCVLDVGCGNGYYGWRMLAEGADLVIGIDPTLIYIMQWLACRHFGGDQPNYVLPLGVEDLPAHAKGFDSVFSMGVLYHRRDPVSHLKRLASLLNDNGQLILETLVLEGEGVCFLKPDSRYARMRNVWAVPTVDQLSKWMSDAGFSSIKIMDITKTSIDEQRSTDWMRFESLAQSLNPQDASKTIEGHPAPVRAAILANKH
jgi:tRNA (mo5U34)-methyltransferase